jgi:hypothetical protein
MIGHAGVIGELARAQGDGDRFKEAELIGRLFRRHRPANQNDGKTNVQRFYEKVAYGLGECWYWVGFRNHLGYGVLGRHRAHRASWRLHIGPIPAGLMVLHSCDVRCCVNPEHLFLGTQTDNMRDMVAKGRHRTGDVSGERNPQSKLTAEQVRRMKAIRAEGGLSYKKIGALFGVGAMTAYRAITGRAWRATV